jgi:hypothetical protein
MAKFTKTEAARQLGIARATLYKLIAQGKVSPTPDGLIDQAELVRVAPYIDTLHERTRTPTDGHERIQTSPDTVKSQPHNIGRSDQGGDTEDVHARPQTGVYERLQTDAAERLQTSTDTLVDILREQLRLMQDREREHARLYEEREQAYREHIAQLTTMLREAHQQNQRLLDMPRPTAQDAPGRVQAPRYAAAHPAPQDAPRRPPGTPYADARGTMRRRILALLREHQEGLTPAEMRTLLGATKRLAQTCLGMRRDGLVQRVERGRYVAV